MLSPSDNTAGVFNLRLSAIYVHCPEVIQSCSKLSDFRAAIEAFAQLDDVPLTSQVA